MTELDLSTTADGRPVEWDERFYSDLCRWRDEDPVVGRKVVEMVEYVLFAPGQGPGRPKRLAGYPGLWSRRVTKTHRLFYVVTSDSLRFLACRGHELPEHLYEELRG